MNLPVSLPAIAWRNFKTDDSEVKVCAVQGEQRTEAKLGNQVRSEGLYAYFLAALGSFTAAALRTYAADRNWGLDRIELSYRRANGDDQSVRREIRLLGDLSTDHEAQLLRVAEECPVHRQLTSRLNVQTTLI